MARRWLRGGGVAVLIALVAGTAIRGFAQHAVCHPPRLILPCRSPLSLLFAETFQCLPKALERSRR